MITTHGDIINAEKELKSLYILRDAVSNHDLLIDTELFLCSIILDFYGIEDVYVLRNKLREMFNETGNVSTEELINKKVLSLTEYEYITVEEDKEKYIAYVVTNDFGNMFFGAFHELLHFGYTHGFKFTDDYANIHMYNLSKGEIILGDMDDSDHDFDFHFDSTTKYGIKLEMIIWKPDSIVNKSSCDFDINIINKQGDEE